MNEREAAEEAYIKGMDDATNSANEERVREFCAELAPSERDRVLAQWLNMVRVAGSNEERARD